LWLGASIRTWGLENCWRIYESADRLGRGPAGTCLPTFFAQMPFAQEFEGFGRKTSCLLGGSVSDCRKGQKPIAASAKVP